MTIMDPDERELAFDALVDLAQATSDALARVQELVDDERRLTSPLRSDFHPTQHASLRGTSRFAYTVREWGAVLEAPGHAKRISSDIQQAQNIWMWLLAERYVLRIKHDLEDLVDPGTSTLFSVAPQENPVLVFLTWDTASDGTIRNVSFATIDEPAWTIPLADLLAAASGTPPPAGAPRPHITARSKLQTPKQDDQTDRG